MTLPQIRLALEEADRAEAGAALLDLSVVSSAMLATAQAKHDAAPLKRLTNTLKKMS